MRVKLGKHENHALVSRYEARLKTCSTESPSLPFLSSSFRFLFHSPTIVRIVDTVPK